MTQPQTQQKKNKLVFATKTLQQVPFELGGQKFFSKRLTGEEEIVFAELNGLRNIGVDVKQQIGHLIDYLTGVLAGRQREGEKVSAEWVGQYIGDVNLDTLMGYLRTGHNGAGLVPAAGTGFDLPTIELDLDELQISGPAMSFSELLEYLDSLPDNEQAQAKYAALTEDPTMLLTTEGKARAGSIFTDISATQRAQYETVARLLAKRQTEGEPITAEYLLNTYTPDEVGQMLTLLRTGEAPEGVDTPNASLMPANLPISG